MMIYFENVFNHFIKVTILFPQVTEIKPYFPEFVSISMFSYENKFSLMFYTMNDLKLLS